MNYLLYRIASDVDYGSGIGLLVLRLYAGLHRRGFPDLCTDHPQL